MSLEAFLHPIREERMKFVASKRFIGEDGKPVEWEIRAITTEEDDSLRRSCMKQTPGRKGQAPLTLDVNKYMGLLAAACTVYPNLNDAELQNSYHVMGNDSLLKAMLKPGEFSDYLLRVQEINGYDVGMDELIEEAKN